MLAVIAGIIFIIGAVLGWTDKALSLEHLVAIGYVAMVFLAAHLAFRFYVPASRL